MGEFKVGVYVLTRKDGKDKIIRVLRSKNDLEYYLKKLKYVEYTFLREI